MGSWIIPFFLLILASCGAPRPLAEGQKFPEIKVYDLRGEPLTLAATGRQRLVSIRTIGCRYCRADFAELSKISRAYEGKGLVVEVISVGAEDAVVRQFLKGVEHPFAVYTDPEMNATRLTRSLILPVTYLVASDGRVLSRLTGGFSLKEIEALVAGSGS